MSICNAHRVSRSVSFDNIFTTNDWPICPRRGHLSSCARPPANVPSSISFGKLPYFADKRSSAGWPFRRRRRQHLADVFGPTRPASVPSRPVSSRLAGRPKAAATIYVSSHARNLLQTQKIGVSGRRLASWSCCHTAAEVRSQLSVKRPQGAGAQRKTDGLRSRRVGRPNRASYRPLTSGGGALKTRRRQTVMTGGAARLNYSPAADALDGCVWSLAVESTSTKDRE